MSSEHEAKDTKHPRLKTAAEVWAVGLGLAAAGVAANALRKRRIQEGATRKWHYSSDEQRLAILSEPKLSTEDRSLMINAAGLIYLATAPTIGHEESAIVTRRDLLALVPVEWHKLQNALSYLKQYDLIDRRMGINPKSRGYYATPALQRAVEDHEQPDLLAAVERLNPNGSL